MRHLYLDHGYNFEYEKAHQLAKVLRASPHRATDVVLAWEALGRYANSALVDYYEDKNRLIQLYALEAGAALGDERTTKVLQRLAKHDDRTIRRRVAAILGSLNRSVRGPRILHDLVSDDDLQVRLLAYESLVRIGDPIIQRTQFAGAGGFKFVLDLVPSQKPLIYIAQSPVPRIVIFDMMLGFAGEPIMSLWNDRLMLRPDGHDTLKVFYQKPGQVEARQIDIRPTVANLVYLMGHHPTVDHPMPGLDLQFTQVAQVLHRLTKQGRIASPIQLQVNPGALTLAKQRQNPPLQPGSARPDIGQAIDMP